MNALNMRTIIIAAIIFLLGIILHPKTIVSQNCGCPTGECCSQFGYCGTGQGFCGPGCQDGPCVGPCHCAADFCCSKWGFCGTGDAYCGTDCQEGPCYGRNNVTIADIVTKEFFDSLNKSTSVNCPGWGFYSRQTFLDSTNLDPSFARTGTEEDSKRELAAFFAHFSFETANLCHIEEINGASRDYCDHKSSIVMASECAPGEKYHGRGPFQLRWSTNYEKAGEAIGFDGLNNPDMVGTNSLVSFKSGIWYWMYRINPVMDQGFGATIRAISGDNECDGGNPAAVQHRVDNYLNNCEIFGVDPGTNISC